MSNFSLSISAFCKRSLEFFNVKIHKVNECVIHCNDECKSVNLKDFKTSKNSKGIE